MEINFTAYYLNVIQIKRLQQATSKYIQTKSLSQSNRTEVSFDYESYLTTFVAMVVLIRWRSMSCFVELAYYGLNSVKTTEK